MNLVPLLIFLVGLISVGMLIVGLLVAWTVTRPRKDRGCALFLLLNAVGALLLFILYAVAQFTSKSD